MQQPQIYRPIRHFCHRLTLIVAGLGALILLTSCMQQAEPLPAQGKNMTDSKKDVAYFDVVLFSYLDRPIFDVYLNGKDIGVASAFGGGGGLMTGIAVPLGPQAISWRDAGTGDTFKAKNQPVLSRPDAKNGYLGVYIYPDNTVEITPSRFWPETTKRGDALYQEWKKRHGEQPNLNERSV